MQKKSVFKNTVKMEKQNLPDKHIERAYVDGFERCVSFTKGLVFAGEEVNEITMKNNIGIARDYYQKIEDKSRISICSLGDLNELERKFNMEVTQ